MNKNEYIGKWICSIKNKHLRPIFVEKVLEGKSGLHLKADGIVIMADDAIEWKPKDGEYCFYFDGNNYILVQCKELGENLYETSLGNIIDIVLDKKLEPYIGNLPINIKNDMK